MKTVLLVEVQYHYIGTTTERSTTKLNYIFHECDKCPWIN